MVLRFLLYDNTLYYKDLLAKAGTVKMRVSRLRILCIEIYKIINSLNPSFTSDIFKVKISQRLRYKLKNNTIELLKSFLTNL